MSAAAAGARRVAVTGLSALSPGGVGVASYRAWRERQRQTGGARGGALVPEFDPAQVIANPKRVRSMHRTFQLGAAAGVLALEAAGLGGADGLARAGIAQERAGLAAAVPDVSPFTADLLAAAATAAPAGELSLAEFAELALHQLHPFRRLAMLPNMAAAHSSLVMGLQGPGFTFTSGGCAGAQTLHEAYWTVADGRADLMLCHAAESPEQCWRRPPAVELAGAAVLEAWESAERRGARILAELTPAPAAQALRGVAGSPAAALLAAILAIAAAAPARLSLAQALAPAWMHEVPA